MFVSRSLAEDMLSDFGVQKAMRKAMRLIPKNAGP
jgi:hypothetical protein